MARIDDAIAAATDGPAAWESFWMDLLAGYERVCADTTDDDDLFAFDCGVCLDSGTVQHEGATGRVTRGCPRCPRGELAVAALGIRRAS